MEEILRNLDKNSEIWVKILYFISTIIPKICYNVAQIWLKKEVHEADIDVNSIHVKDFSENNKMIIHNNIAEPWKVTLVDTGLHTQTGGRIKRVREYIGNETFMLTYGDGVSDVDIDKLVEFHKAHGKLATMPNCSSDATASRSKPTATATANCQNNPDRWGDSGNVFYHK